MTFVHISYDSGHWPLVVWPWQGIMYTSPTTSFFSVSSLVVVWGFWWEKGWILYPDNQLTHCFNLSSYYRFLDNGIWKFVSFTSDLETIVYPCCPRTPYYELVFTIIFRRNPSFYVSYLILPCIFLSGLSLLVFYLPPDCGEKLTLSITNLLSLVVFQQLIAETMPPTAEENPILGEYCQGFLSNL